MKLTKFITIACIFSLVACSEPIKVTPLTATQVFSGATKKTWVVRNLQVIQDGRGTYTFPGFVDCVADDQYVFSNDFNRTYQVLDGSKKCDASDPDVLVDSNWSFVNATSTLTIIMPLLSDQPLPFTVKQVDNLVIVMDIYVDDAKTSAYRVNFVAVNGD